VNGGPRFFCRIIGERAAGPKTADRKHGGPRFRMSHYRWTRSPDQQPRTAKTAVRATRLVRGSYVALPVDAVTEPTAADRKNGGPRYPAAEPQTCHALTSLRCRRIQALASFQSRITVTGETPNTSAVSSTLRPPK